MDPSLLISGQRLDGTFVPADNYAMTFARVDAITALLYGDLSWLYKGNEALKISLIGFINNFVFNLVNMLISPLLFIPMSIWLMISTSQVLILWLYTETIDGPRSKDQ